jgi:hypothetical protein
VQQPEAIANTLNPNIQTEIAPPARSTRRAESAGGAKRHSALRRKDAGAALFDYDRMMR